MSIALTNAVYGRKLSAKLQRVLLVLCDFANDDGVCWPSLGLMAWKLELNERTIRRAIDDLEAMGVIAIDHRAGQSHRFHIDLSGLPIKPPYRPATAGQNVHASEDEAMGKMSDQPQDKMSTVREPDHGQNVHPTPDILSATPDILSTNRRTKCPPEPREPSQEPSREPPDVAPAVQPFDLLESLCESVGQDVSVLSKNEKGKQLAVAKRLVSAGMTPIDVQRMTRWLLGQAWVTSGVDLFLLEKQLGKWQLAGKPSSATTRASPAMNGYRSGKDVGYSLDDLVAMARGESQR